MAEYAGLGLGVSSVRPAGSDSRHFQSRALPKAVRLAGCRRVSSRRRERWVGLRTAAGEPRSSRRIPDSARSVWTALATNADSTCLTGFRAFKSDYAEKK